MKEYIIIDKLGGAKYAFILVNENFDTLVFTDKNEAEKYAAENCQDGIVVEL